MSNAKELLTKYLDQVSVEIYNEIAANPRVAEPSMVTAIEATDRMIEHIYTSFKSCSECEMEMFHVKDDYMCIGCRSKQ